MVEPEVAAAAVPQLVRQKGRQPIYAADMSCCTEQERSAVSLAITRLTKFVETAWFEGENLFVHIRCARPSKACRERDARAGHEHAKQALRQALTAHREEQARKLHEKDRQAATLGIPTQRLPLNLSPQGASI